MYINEKYYTLLCRWMIDSYPLVMPLSIHGEGCLKYITVQKRLALNSFNLESAVL